MNMLTKFFKKPINVLACYSIRDDLNASERKILKEYFHLCEKDAFDIFEKNEISSISYNNLKKIVPDSTKYKWNNSYECVKQKISAMFEELSVLGNLFYENNITVIALKNGGLAQLRGNDYAEHPMGDIDLFVSKDEFLKAHSIIIKQGFIFEFRSDYENENLEKAFSDGSTEYYKVLENGNKMWLELSWRSVSGRWINRDKEPSAKELIKNCIAGDIKGISLLSPEDNLLQVSIHTAKHSYFRAPGFRLHLDVKRVITYFDIDWSLFLRKVEDAGTRTAVYFSLYFSKKFLNANVPEFVLEQLKPSSLKKFIIFYCLRSFNLSSRFYFKRFEFLLFQISLYDNLSDIYQVAIPSQSFIKKKYEKKSLIIGYITHVLDLIGFRKNYKNG